MQSHPSIALPPGVSLFVSFLIHWTTRCQLNLLNRRALGRKGTVLKTGLARLWLPGISVVGNLKIDEVKVGGAVRAQEGG